MKDRMSYQDFHARMTGKAPERQTAEQMAENMRAWGAVATARASGARI